MAYPADDGLFILETDASHTGIDATLSQVQWYEQSQKKRGATNHICQPIHNELQSMVNHRLVILLVQFIMLLTLTFAVVFSTLSRTNEEMRTCLQFTYWAVLASWQTRKSDRSNGANHLLHEKLPRVYEISQVN